MLSGTLYALLPQGKLSDNYGRKTILLASYIGPGIGYFVIGLSGSLLILVLSRIPIGKGGLPTKLCSPRSKQPQCKSLPVLEVLRLLVPDPVKIFAHAH